jgi:hypothetical protein
VKTSLSSLSPRALIALAAGGVLVWTLVLWLLYVSPHRSEASRLSADVAAAELELADAQVATRPRKRAAGPVSDVFRLAKAMPESSDQSTLVLELTRLAKSSGVTLRSIASQAPTDGGGGTTMVPVTVTVEGKFGRITRFLERTRSLVAVRRGRLRATGRMFAVKSVELAESISRGFPQLDATITLGAYVYDGPLTPAELPSGDESQGDQTTPSGSTSAAGSTG